MLAGDRLDAVGVFADLGWRACPSQTGEIQVLINWKWVSALSVASALAACGGGGSSSNAADAGFSVTATGR